MHLSGKIARMILIDSKQLNEVELRRILPYNRIRPICGTIAYDYPSQRRQGLRYDSFDQLLNIPLFVVGGCYQYVSCFFRHGVPHETAALTIKA